jgi:hypothetical protein
VQRTEASIHGSGALHLQFVFLPFYYRRFAAMRLLLRLNLLRLPCSLEAMPKNVIGLQIASPAPLHR